MIESEESLKGIGLEYKIFLDCTKDNGDQFNADYKFCAPKSKNYVAWAAK